MKKHQNIWLPDGEQHFQEWMTRNGEIVDGKGTYQIQKLRAATELCERFRVAVDVGAHVGLWSMQLQKRFRLTHAFEPVAMFRECFLKNINPTRPDAAVILYDCALGHQPGVVELEIPALDGGIDSGGTHVVSNLDERYSPRRHFAELRTLDSFDFDYVDFMKIDCEGFEYEVILGAHDTIVRCRPVIIVEQKQHKLSANYGKKGTPAVDLLRDSHRYSLAREIGGDYIMVPK